jgi:hypothetical protein
MARRLPIWVPYAVFGTGVATLMAAGVMAVLPDGNQELELCRGWVEPDAPYEIRRLAREIEKITNLEGFGDFLAGVAWVESRGNPRAGSDASNAARGWFGMRPESARVSDLGLLPSAIKDGPTAVALAAWYAHRCQVYADPGQVMDWLAVRRCWGKPSDVDDVDHPGYRAQLAAGLECAGADPDLMNDVAFGSRYKWPGIEKIFEAVGRKLPYPAYA